MGQLQNTWQLGVQGFFTQVVQFQEYVISIVATATAFQNFQNHRAGHNVTTSKVFSVRRITFHETLTVFVDQVTTFTTTAFSNQYTSAGNTGWVELPHFHILHRHAGADRHTNTITSVDQSIGSGLINTAGTAGRQNSRLGFNENSFAGFDFDGDNTSNLAFFIFHQINGVPFVQEGSTAFQVTLIQGVQHRYGQPGHPYRNLWTDHRRDADKYDLLQYGRTADPCGPVQIPPEDQSNTYIQLRPGHRCSRNLLRCRTCASANRH